MNHTANALIEAADALTHTLSAYDFCPPASHVYNPLQYARSVHSAYLQRYARKNVRVLFLGMNPGPFGMAQTGVPFGEIAAVRDWLQLSGSVDKPANENPARPVSGFACTRSEVSGRRLWGLFEARFGSAEAFFKTHFVANYCPLIFFQHGRNLTPDKLPVSQREPLLAACDQHLLKMLAILQPQWLVGIGAWATARARKALQGKADAVQIGQVLHPSPASPAANRGWSEQATAQLQSLGIW